MNINELITNQHKKKYIRLYKRAFKRLGNTTPLNIDCGELCNEKCCSGSDDDGMLLFPGEEFLYIDKSWCYIKDSNIKLSDGYCIKLLVCDGTCPRQERPLSCRIFPLVPYINEHGRVEFRIDPRSLNLCPIALEPDKYSVEIEFVDRLYKTFPPVLKDKRVVEFIEILSCQYDEMIDIVEMFSD